jgi:hypothetical protein
MEFFLKHLFAELIDSFYIAALCTNQLDIVRVVAQVYYSTQAVVGTLVLLLSECSL